MSPARPTQPTPGRPPRPRPSPRRPETTGHPPAARPETTAGRAAPTPRTPAGDQRSPAPPGVGIEPAGLLEPTVTTYAAGRQGPVPVRPSVVSAGSAARFAERARARRSLARRQVLGVAGGVVLVAGAGWLVFGSPVLALDPAQVSVSGAGTVVAVDQVEAAVAARAGTPLPRLGTVALRDAILEVPGVREARVTRDWPRGLVVELVAREPVAAVPEVATPEDPTAVLGLTLLDRDGVQVGRVAAAPDGLPVVDVPVGDARTLTAVLAVLEALPAELLAEVADVSARTQDTVTMRLRDGVSVEWGNATQSALKIAVLKVLRAAPTSAGALVYDVSAPTMPVTRGP